MKNCLTCKYEPDWECDLPECEFVFPQGLPVIFTIGELCRYGEDKVVCEVDCHSWEIINCPAHEPKED